MRKAKLSLLAAALLAGMAGTTMAADRAGFGLEWGVGPTIVLGPWDMKMDQSFGVDWMINEDFSVALFGSTGDFSGEYEYTDDVTTANQTFDRRIQVFGKNSVTAMRLSYAMPFMKILKLGLEFGTAAFSEDGNSPRYRNSDGTQSTVANFGGTRDPFDQVGALEGINARLNVLNGASGAVTASLAIQASVRFVQFPELRVFGIQETTVDPNLHPVKDEIESISGYNTLSVAAALNVGF